MAADKTKPLIGILMGSKSDWEVMQHCAAQLEDLEVPWEAQAISAHRAPDALSDYLSTAMNRGLEVIIAAAGGAAHLPGVCAAKTTLPVLGVPMESPSLKGLDSRGVAGSFDPRFEAFRVSQSLRGIPSPTDG